MMFIRVWKADNNYIRVLLVLLMCCGIRSADVYHIRPSPNHPCSTEPCLTLTEFANKSHIYLESNMTLILLPGYHSLDAEFFVHNVTELVIFSSTMNASDTVIVCQQHAMLIVEDANLVHIKYVTFTGCTENRIVFVFQFMLEGSTFTTQSDSADGTALLLVETSAKVMQSSFRFNRANKFYNVAMVYVQPYGHDTIRATAGGAIVSINSSMVITESVFEGNNAAIGGAIFAMFSDSIIINSTFENNRAEAMAYTQMLVGSVLYVQSGGTVVISGSHFFNNSAHFWSVGGVMASMYTNIAISDSKFISNHADRGGIVYIVEAGTIFISNSEFVNNYAREGGIVYAYTLYTARVLIMQSQFVDNYAHSGGVVSGYSKLSDQSVMVIITDSKFVSNQAEQGGVLYLSSDIVNITIYQSEFHNNSATNSGGVVQTTQDLKRYSGLQTSVITIAHSEFVHNCAESGNGGVISATLYEQITITHCSCMNNRGSKGGVTFTLSQSIYIAYSEFSNNIADVGGVISDLSANVVISHCQFFNNSALSTYGGVFHGESFKFVSIAYSNFINNSAPVGGVIFADGENSEVTIAHCEFINNTAQKDGGVLHAQKCYSAVIIHNKFINNSVQNDGGVLWSRFSSSEEYMKITESLFINCKAENNGGAIHVFQGILVISNSSFCDNSVDNDGGVLYMDQTKARISEAMFRNNRAERNGGTMLIVEGEHLVINSTNFLNNSAGNSGGVLLSYDNNINVYGSRFHTNSASHDGGVFSLIIISIMMIDCSFDYNSAGHDGGVFQIYQGTSNFSVSTFYRNTALNDGGTILVYQTFTSISQCLFNSNSANNDGGAIKAYQGSLSISDDSNFTYNRALNDGGAINANELHAVVAESSYDRNTCGNKGGVWFAYQGNLTVTQSILSHSEAANGAVMYINQGYVTIENISCIRNSADRGGAFNTDQSTARVRYSAFSQNSAFGNGGAWFMDNSSSLLQGVSITSNTAKVGGAVYSSISRIKSTDFLLIHNNTATTGILYMAGSQAHFSDTVEFSTNSGSCLLFNSIVTFRGHSRFLSFYEPVSNDTTKLQEGGALTSFKSNVIIDGISELTNNHAENGGAIHATESRIHIFGNTTIANNSATKSGGGIYLYMSELYCQGHNSLVILSNTAIEKGGGIHVISSTINAIGNFTYNKDNNITNSPRAIYIGSRIYFVENEAEKGGALCLESNAKVYILKSIPYSEPIDIISFLDNSADYGGAVYVSDDSYLGMCNPNYESHFKAKECFIQTLAIYGSIPFNYDEQAMNITNIFFAQNSAQISGSALFGGLIDRCIVHHFTEHQTLLFHKDSIYQKPHSLDSIVDGISYIRSISNIDPQDIGSQPVQLCFCENSKPVCDYEPGPVRVIKGKRFSVELIAVDQVDHPVNATIYSSLYKTGGGLVKGQSIQYTTTTCTKLNFNLFSPSDKEELIMYADGPCMYSPQSQRRLDIQFTACDSCPIGFEKHVDETTVCECICDSKLEPYITRCNASTELLEREGSFWITYISTGDNATSGYLIYPHCPLNYCIPPTSKIEINLNIPSGDNVQCADGRSGMLCGACQSNLSLSLGSTRCIPCSDKWFLTLIIIVLPFIICGIALVALLLVLNLTVAVGTLNGVIFYANIVAANSSTFLPFSAPNFATIFIAWLNLDFGFDACLFPGMDSYWKTLFQLAFPTYVIFLVAMVIIISEHSTKFAQLVAKKNPVATLATLILLSYTKFLNTVIASLSFAVLNYPDGSQHIVWLPDATVTYLRGKHIALFVLALVILFAGAAYTGLLLLWQWFLKYQDKKVFEWIKHQKLCHFMEPYHAPYAFEQRYWTGLLLLVRVLLYIVSAANITGDPRMALVSTAIVVGCLPALKGILERKIYKKWVVDISELFIYINIVTFTTLTLYTFDGSKTQRAIAYTSVTITFTLLVAVIMYHIIHYTGLLSMLKVKYLAHKMNLPNNYHRIQTGTPVEINQPLITETVVELPKPYTELESVVKNEEGSIIGSNQTDTVNTANDGELYCILQIFYLWFYCLLFSITHTSFECRLHDINFLQ